MSFIISPPSDLSKWEEATYRLVAINKKTLHVSVLSTRYITGYEQNVRADARDIADDFAKLIELPKYTKYTNRFIYTLMVLEDLKLER